MITKTQKKVISALGISVGASLLILGNKPIKILGGSLISLKKQTDLLSKKSIEEQQKNLNIFLQLNYFNSLKKQLDEITIS